MGRTFRWESLLWGPVAGPLPVPIRMDRFAGAPRLGADSCGDVPTSPRPSAGALTAPDPTQLGPCIDHTLTQTPKRVPLIHEGGLSIPIGNDAEPQMPYKGLSTSATRGRSRNDRALARCCHPREGPALMQAGRGPHPDPSPVHGRGADPPLRDYRLLTEWAACDTLNRRYGHVAAGQRRPECRYSVVLAEARSAFGCLAIMCRF